MRRSAMMVVMLMGLAGAARAQDPAKPPGGATPPEPVTSPVVPTGAVPSTDSDLTPGDKAPDFRLDSSLGGTVGLADLKGHWSVLVFDESRTNLVPLQAVEDPLRALGARPLGVCPDGIGALRTLAAREKLGFPLLSDPTREISQLFGMYDDDDRAIQPGLVIVDPQGIVRMVIQGPSLHPDDVLRMTGHVLRGL
jgi:peroxiredoxin